MDNQFSINEKLCCLASQILKRQNNSLHNSSNDLLNKVSLYSQIYTSIPKNHGRSFYILLSFMFMCHLPSRDRWSWISTTSLSTLILVYPASLSLSRVLDYPGSHYSLRSAKKYNDPLLQWVI